MASANIEARSKVKEIWQRDKKFPRKETADMLGIHVRSIYKWIKQFENSKPTQRKIKNLTSFRTLATFRSLYDDSVIIPCTIEEGINKYLVSENGDPGWMRDPEFREACGIPVVKWRRYADQYGHLQVAKGKDVFWGHPDIIDEMRKAVNR